jgi:hypothetical protein
MKALPLLKQLTVAIAITVISQVALAQTPKGRVFGDGTPYGLTDLPPGRAKAKLESLPAPAQRRALEWLHSFSFHESDLEFIYFDNEGGVFYQETDLPEQIDPASSADGGPVIEAAADVFALHSKPSSSNVLVLDFDGHEITGTAWNSGGPSTYYAAPFSLDSDDNTFTDLERGEIQQIWHRIAEDFAPFDIDVTTQEPSTLTNTTGRVLITRNTDASGQAMPWSTAGGVAYVGVWGRSDYDYYSPALVYYDNLSSYSPYIAEAASHEAGHNLNLSHDGTSSYSYYSGHGSGYVSWAPIMGAGYYDNVTQWSKGEYSGANQTQDDIGILTDYLDLRTDDHSDTSSSSTELVLTNNTLVEVSNPETDPNNLYPENKGIIEDRDDIDTFTFVAGGGTIDITATPAWDAYYRTSRRGANLDIELTLLGDNGVVASSDPVDDTSAQILANVPAGRYYLEVTGVGNSLSPYSDYGSLGQYFISGSISASGDADTTPPNPNPMSWSATPFATDSSSIEMTATTAIDDSGAVEYQFICVAGSSDCQTSSWQTNPAYTATGLTADTTYSFQVVARDSSNNVTAPSETASATTPTSDSNNNSNNTPIAVDDAASVATNASVNIPVLSNDYDTDGDPLTVISVSSANKGAVSLSENIVTYTAGTKRGGDTLTYEISDGISTSTATISVSISGSGGGGGGGGSGKCHPKKGC